MAYSYKYPHPALTADCVIFSFSSDNSSKSYSSPSVLLVQRRNEPYKGFWALPGGFMNIDETIEQCAARELQEETSLKDVQLTQLHVYSTVNRDSRERVVSVAFVGTVNRSEHEAHAGDDALLVEWFSIDSLPPLAFDHKEIITEALKKTISY
jgi:8-oxo-dGTP diphosphatase